MYKVAIISKYLPYYRLAVFNRLSLIDEPKYEIVADNIGREGIRTIPEFFAYEASANGGISWTKSKSYYYKNSLQLWQTQVLVKIFNRNYKLFILDGATSHISTWVFAILSRLAGKKVIFWSHGLKGIDDGIKKIIKTIFFKYLPHGLILYGDFSRNLMISHGYNPDKIFVIGNSLNYPEQIEIRNKLLKDKTHLSNLKSKIFKSDFKTIIFIGRLVPNKKVNEIIEALRKLKSENLNLNCIIIGDGPDKEFLTSKISESGMSPQFYFPGELYDEEKIAELFLISDLMISPGNVGLNCIHALAYGVPVLTHNNFSFQNPEVESVNHGRNGLLYKYGDFTDLVEKIRLWFSSDHPELTNECLKPIENKYNPTNHSYMINLAVKSILEQNK